LEVNIPAAQQRARYAAPTAKKWSGHWRRKTVMAMHRKPM